MHQPHCQLSLQTATEPENVRFIFDILVRLPTGVMATNRRWKSLKQNRHANSLQCFAFACGIFMRLKSHLWPFLSASRKKPCGFRDSNYSKFAESPPSILFLVLFHVSILHSRVAGTMPRFKSMRTDLVFVFSYFARNCQASNTRWAHWMTTSIVCQRTNNPMNSTSPIEKKSTWLPFSAMDLMFHSPLPLNAPWISAGKFCEARQQAMRCTRIPNCFVRWTTYRYKCDSFFSLGCAGGFGVRISRPFFLSTSLFLLLYFILLSLLLFALLDYAIHNT